jgi:hypothetical protein
MLGVSQLTPISDMGLHRRPGPIAAGFRSLAEVLSLCGSDASVIWWSHDEVRNWCDRRLLR